jgi:Lrp/AsnC family transcriptional regulator for asnA, asnC and gidA
LEPSKKKIRNKAKALSSINTNLASAPKMDRIDRQIIGLLQADGRRSFSSIARELGLSETTIRNRVDYLQKNNHLKFLAVIDPTQAGFGNWAMLGIKVVGGASPQMLGKKFSNLEEAVWVGTLGGRYDLMVEVWAAGTEELTEFLENHCHSCLEISSVEVMVGLKIQKWGVALIT